MRLSRSQIVNFPTWIPDCDFHSSAFLDLFISAMTFSPLGNSDLVVVSVSIDFPSAPKWNATLHCGAYDYSPTDVDGCSMTRYL